MIIIIDLFNGEYYTLNGKYLKNYLTNKLLYVIINYKIKQDIQKERKKMATRQQKYPETKTFTYYNANPKGKITCDCVARAICTALDEPYEQILKEMFEMQIETGYEYTDGKCIDKYLQSKGWMKMKQPRKSNNKKYTGDEFCRIYKGTCVANIGGNHTVCIKNGKVHDTWDSTDGCIGNYWVKK